MVQKLLRRLQQLEEREVSFEDEAKETFYINHECKVLFSVLHLMFSFGEYTIKHEFKLIRYLFYCSVPACNSLAYSKRHFCHVSYMYMYCMSLQKMSTNLLEFPSSK